MNPLLAAVQFLTRVPTGGRHLSANDRERAAGWYGMVGLGLGGVLAGLNALVSRWAPAGPRLALVLVAGFLLTGGLHLDGLADSADGLLGSRERERSLEIMRDSRIGTFGAVAVMAVLALQWSALVELSRPMQTAALVLAPGLGRAALPAAALGAIPARAEGLGAWFVHTVTPGRVAGAAAPVLVLALMLAGVTGVVGCLVALATVLAWRRWVEGRLGGPSGDTLGATSVLVETFTIWTCLLMRTR